MGELLASHSDTGIADAEEDGVAVFAELEANLAALGELYRVAYEVDEDLPHLAGIALDLDRRRGDVASKTQSFPLGEGRRDDADLMHHLLHGEALDRDSGAIRLQAYKAEKAFDQGEQLLGALVQPAQRLVLLARDRTDHTVGENLGVAEDCRERGAELVRHRGEKFVLRLIRRLRRSEQPFALRFATLSLGRIDHRAAQHHRDAPVGNRLEGRAPARLDPDLPAIRMDEAELDALHAAAARVRCAPHRHLHALDVRRVNAGIRQREGGALFRADPEQLERPWREEEGARPEVEVPLADPRGLHREAPPLLGVAEVSRERVRCGPTQATSPPHRGNGGRLVGERSELAAVHAAA
jgi:hypothetical protein